MEDDSDVEILDAGGGCGGGGGGSGNGSRNKISSGGEDDVVIVSSSSNTRPHSQQYACPHCTLNQPPSSAPDASCVACGLPLNPPSSSGSGSAAAGARASSTGPPTSAAGAGAGAGAGSLLLHPSLLPHLMAFESSDTPLKSVLARLSAAIRRPGGQTAGVLQRRPAVALSDASLPLGSPSSSSPSPPPSAYCTDFYSQTVEGAGWACGYRCLQMLLSPLLAHPRTRPTLFDGSGRMPTIATLQACIEQAWARGYDPVGAEQLGGRLQGGRDFIGAGEAVALLRSLGVPAQWLSFHSPDDPNLEQIAPKEVCDRLRGEMGGLGFGGGGGTNNGSGNGSGGGVQRTIHQSFGLPTPSRSPPLWHSCRPCDFDACGSCHAAKRQGVLSHPHPLQAVSGEDGLPRQCNLCGKGGGGGGGGGRGGWAPKPEPAKTPAQRRALVGRHRALLRWAKGHWGVEFKPASSGSGSGGGSGSGSGSGIGSCSGGGMATSSPPMPVYLQHDGHSRVLVGYEVTEPSEGGVGGGAAGSALAGSLATLVPGDYHLSMLILDPGTSKGELGRALGEGGGAAWAPLVKRGLHTLRHAHYEVAWVPRVEEWGNMPPIKGPLAGPRRVVE